MSVGAVTLKLVGLGLLGVALLGISWMLTAAPWPRPVRLGVRGVRRQHALRHNSAWRTLEPLVRFMGERVRGRVPSSWLAGVEHQLTRCGDPLGLAAEELVALSCTSSVVGLGAGLTLGPAVGMGWNFALFVAPLAAAFPHLAISHAGAARRGRIRRSWPHLLELLALAVGAGSDFTGGIRHIIDRSTDPDDDLVLELGHLLRELQLGFTRRRALERLAMRVPLDEVAEFVSAVTQSEERGTPLAHVLRTQATGARARRTVRGEEAASRAGVKMVVPLFLVFISILLLVLGPPLLAVSGQTYGGPGW